MSPDPSVQTVLLNWTLIPHSPYLSTRVHDHINGRAFTCTLRYRKSIKLNRYDNDDGNDRSNKTRAAFLNRKHSHFVIAFLSEGNSDVVNKSRFGRRFAHFE